MTLTAERARTFAIYDKYGPLLCEECEVGSPNPYAPLADVYPEKCPDCIAKSVTTYNSAFHVHEDGSWEEWTVADIGYLNDFPWEVWIEEPRI